MVNEKYYEKCFFEVLDDLEDYRQFLTLVGGWLVYVYFRFLWNFSDIKPIHTTDIDFGVNESNSNKKSKTIFEKLSSMDYKERHILP